MCDIIIIYLFIFSSPIFPRATYCIETNNLIVWFETTENQTRWETGDQTTNTDLFVRQESFIHSQLLYAIIYFEKLNKSDFDLK